MKRVAGGAQQRSHGVLVAAGCATLVLALFGFEAVSFISPLQRQTAIPARGTSLKATTALPRLATGTSHGETASPSSILFGAGALIAGLALSSSSRRTSKRSSMAASVRVAMKSSMKEDIDALIAKHPVFMISKKFCPFCRKAKAVLDDMGVQYEVLELESSPGSPLVDDPAAVQDYMLEKTGARSVPRVFINGHFVGGGDDIVAKRASGELATLLQSVGAALPAFEDPPFVLDQVTVEASEQAVAATGVNVGGPLPNIVVQRGDEFPPSDFNLTEFVQGKKVVLVGLPGAFTPT